ncbi:MAG: hypothetical protein ACLGIK_12620 [Gemmatimonadota bacterium]
MSPRLAVELTPTHLRAVLAAGWRDTPLRFTDIAWTPADPDAGIAALRGWAGNVDAIAVAVGLGMLHVARAELPPSPDEARERMLALESERFFATSAALTVSLAPGGEVAFAADAGALDGWCAALERWAPLVRVDPAPVALARALGTKVSGEYRIDAAPGEHGYVAIRDGRVTAVRRIPLTLGDSPGAALPARDGVPGSHLAAWGALSGEDAAAGGTLAAPPRRATLTARRRRRLWGAAAAAAAGLALAVTSADRWRERTLRALEDEIATLRDGAAPGEAALAARQRLDAEIAIIARSGRAHSGAMGTLGALAAISNALPADAVILNAHAVGREWQVDGTAASAAALVPRLDQDGRFEQVRILGASSRFRDGARTRETFTIALRVPPGS